MESRPLSHHPIYAGTGVDEAREVLSHLFTEARIDPLATGQPLSTHMNGIELAHSTICYLEFADGLLATPVAPMGCHTIQCPLTSISRFDIEGQVADADAQHGVVISEGQQIRVKLMPDTRMLCFNVKNDVLRDIVAAVTGRPGMPDIRFEPRFDWTTPQAASLQALLRTFTVELNRPRGIVESPAALASFEQTLITLMLFSLNHNLSYEIRIAGRDAGLQKVRFVEEYITEHAVQPINMQTIAQATGHSANSIFRAFQKYRDYTPMQFLRSVRLNMVRERLLLSQTAISVSSVAIECGFTHLGRFSVAYRRRYGESPSDTLRRGTEPRV